MVTFVQVNLEGDFRNKAGKPKVHDFNSEYKSQHAVSTTNSSANPV